MAASYNARHWPDHQEQFQEILRRSSGGGDQTTVPGINARLSTAALPAETHIIKVVG